MKKNIQAFTIPELLIDKRIFLFLNSLLKSIFLDKVKYLGKINVYISRINSKFIKNARKNIKNEFSIENMENILDFIKSQNKIFAGDIFEAILINIFSQAFDKKKADKDETLGKYIYKNLSGINEIKENFNFFDKDKFKKEIGIQNIPNLLMLDSGLINSRNYVSELETKNIYFFKVFKNLLLSIVKEKNILNSRNGIYHKLLDYNTVINAQSSLYLDKLLFVRFFFISVFIYYQNKNSPLMKYIPSKSNQKEELDENSLAYIPFSYDLRGAEVTGNASIISPIKLDPRITNVFLDNNNLQEAGIQELCNALIFNKGIKCICNNKSSLKSCYLEFFSHLMGIYNNYTLEELHLSNNFLKENSEEYLSKLIPHLKGLKTLNLSFNDLKNGLASSFVVLRKLYRKGKSKLENLYLKNCTLNEESIFELGELLKSKFCKLKILCLNMNYVINNSDFLKKIKKNKSLEELYLNQSDIGNNDINGILRIINLTNIKTLYLYKTKITDFNKFLTILFRTKIIKEDSDDLNAILDEGVSFNNLDLSGNKFNNKTENHIVLLTKIIKETSLSCLDISNILDEKDKKDEIDNNNEKDENFQKKIEELIKILQNDKKNYKKYMIELRKNKVDIERYKNKDEEEAFKYIDTFYKIIENKRANQDLFLIQIADKISKNKEILNVVKNQDIRDNLINYMKYLRAKFQSEENEKKLKRKKLILI